VLSPTATSDLAAAVALLLEREASGTVPYGLYHLTNAGSCSWYELARAIFARCGMRVDLAPIPTTASGATARRPPYSVLAHDRWRAAGFAELRPWDDALAAYLRAKGYAT
jgi:dTDP-4-dehydrorhamnose reductase